MAASVAAPVVVPLPRGGALRLAGIGAVVFLANVGLLVLQLVAGRLLAPFVGSSLETWTAIIGAFLAGIALGNAVGGRLADRHPTPRLLAVVLALGAVAALWTVALPLLLDTTALHRPLPLELRIPFLAAALCFPPGFVLSLLTPLAIKLGLPDVRHAGRVAGVIFALGALGCLAGNYATGFYLIPHFAVNVIVYLVAGLLSAVALGALFLSRGARASTPLLPLSTSPTLASSAQLTLARAAAIVALASFAGMALELAAARLLAQVLGVSLYTWTGVIGVMLAGTATGNWLGGILADRAARRADPLAGRQRLAVCLILAAMAAAGVILLFAIGTSVLERSVMEPEQASALGRVLLKSDLVAQVLLWTFCLFFLPMLLLGTVSPQVIRLAVPDVAHAGRVAGRVYAWSTVGAIVGTSVTGFVLVSTVGVLRVILLAAALPALAALFALRVWQRPVLLYAQSIALGCVIGGFILSSHLDGRIVRETNYYTIAVVVEEDEPELRTLMLDRLIHSVVNVEDPNFIYYDHEQTQMELLRAIADAHPREQRVLVIGGGGYTFPRAARTQMPTARMEVVEIDPGVTAVAYSHLGLDPRLDIATYHLDGRQFVAERAERGAYHLVVLDAVNDLSVPYHLLTREFNTAVQTTLAPDGVYLVTVIDHLEDGKLWRATFHTLRQTFPHVELLSTDAKYDSQNRQVYVFYAANQPLDLDALRTKLKRQGVENEYTHRLPPGEIERLLGKYPAVVLTDQYAPVDNLMAEVFRRWRRE
jgi:spermidine synthase/MFS family permease